MRTFLFISAIATSAAAILTGNSIPYNLTQTNSIKKDQPEVKLFLELINSGKEMTLK